MPILRVTDLCKTYDRGGVPSCSVDGACLTVERGERVNVIGRSGSGKSTLLSMVAGLLRPTSGTVELDGRDVWAMDDAERSRLRNEHIGIVPQGAAALPYLTLLENVMLPLCLQPRGGDVEGAAHLSLDRCGVGRLADAYPSEVSGGELRRAMIARAIVARPALLIADEPTSDLDAASARAVMELLSQLGDDGPTVLLASHDLDALRYGTRTLTMIEGQLVEGDH